MLRRPKGSRIIAVGLERFRDPLYRNASLLMLIAVLGGGSGFAFWLIAARYYTPEEVGVAASLISLASLVGFFSSLGLGAGLIRFLPTSSTSRNRRINASVTLAGVTALGVGLLLLSGLALWAPAVGFVGSSLSYALLFLVFAIGLALAPLVDSSFLGARRASFVLYRSLVYNSVRLPLPLLLATLLGTIGILFSLGVALSLSLGLSLFFLLPRLYPGFSPAPSLRLKGLRDMVNYSLENHVANLLYALPAGLLPLLVLSAVSASSAAHFYMAWILAGFLFLIPASSAASLFVEGSQPGTHFATDAVRSLRFGILVLIPGVLTLFLAGPLLLGLFGVDYSREGVGLLRILAISAFFVAINTTFFSFLRVDKRVKELILLSATLGVGIVIASYLLIGVYGPLGPGLAFLALQAVVSGYVVVRHLPATKEVARALIRP